MIPKGDITTQSKPFVFPLRDENLVSKGPFESIEIRIVVFDGANGRSLPRHPDDGMSTPLICFLPFLFSIPKLTSLIPLTGPRTLVTLSADLSRIPTAQLDKQLGADGKEYYEIGYEIRGVFYSAHTEYSLWHKDQCYGKVDAKYE
jgi:hypothetical protein